MLEGYRDKVYRCIRCGLCRAKYDYFDKIFRVCPVGEHSGGFESYFPRGRLAVALEILEGNLTYSDALAEVIYDCTLCANCREVCGAMDTTTAKPLIDTPAIVKAMRAGMFAAGIEIPDGVTRFGDAVEKTHNIFGAPSEERNSWWLPELKVEKDADCLYFPGCLASYRVPEIAQATAKILNNLGIKFSILGEEEHCCGDPLIMTGQLPLAREVAQYNWECLRNKKVITSCAGCYRCFKEEYPKLLGEEFMINVIHTSELLAELIKDGKIKFKGEVREKVTYHDPCELGREMKIYDQPRKVIQSIPGVELVEMTRNRERTWCCGGGGGVKGANPDLSLEIGKDKVKEALATGAETIVSACPSCKININDAIAAVGAELKVIDITELVARAVVSKEAIEMVRKKISKATDIPEEIWEWLFDRWAELWTVPYKDEIVAAGLAGLSFTETAEDMPGKRVNYVFGPDGIMRTDWKTKKKARGEVTVIYESFEMAYRHLADENTDFIQAVAEGKFTIQPIERMELFTQLPKFLPVMMKAWKQAIEEAEKHFNVEMPKYGCRAAEYEPNIKLGTA